MYSVEHHGIPHPPIHPRIKFSSLGWTGIQWRPGDQNQCKTPSQVHPDHIIPQQESDPKACTARNAFVGSTFCTARLHYGKRKIGESVIVHTSTNFQKPRGVWFMWYCTGAVLGGAHSNPFLLKLETRDAIRMKVADLRVCESTADPTARMLP